MLIKCPECGKEISNKTPACIHCGYPLENKTKGNRCIIFGVEYDFSSLVKETKEMKTENLSYGTCCAVLLSRLQEITKDSVNNYGELASIIAKTETIPPTFTPKPKEEPKVRCPRCNSTQITTGPRGANGFWGFIGASKTVNRCAACGKTWEP